ncbi:hypothetical protein H4R35_001151 [Dimargaris xerosporica]|nr:hypothetical protein H4R35_001151 [Dimargaris xerosporica]
MHTPPGSASRAVGSHFKFTLPTQPTGGRRRRFSTTTSPSHDALRSLTPAPSMGLPPLPQQQQQQLPFFVSPQTPSPFRFSIPARTTRHVDQAQVSRDKDIISMFSSFHSPLSDTSRPAMTGMAAGGRDDNSRVDDIESPGPIDAEVDLMATDDLFERERRRALLFSLEDEQEQAETMDRVRGNVTNKRPSSHCIDTQPVPGQDQYTNYSTAADLSALPLPTSCGSTAPVRVSQTSLATPRVVTLESAATATNSGLASQSLTAIRNRLAPQFQVAISPPSQLTLHTANQSGASFHFAETLTTRIPLPVGSTQPIRAPQPASPSRPKRKRFRVTPGGYLDQLYTVVRQERSDHVLWHHETHSRFADSSYLLANQQHLQPHQQSQGPPVSLLSHISSNGGIVPADMDQPWIITLSHLTQRLSPTSVEAVVACPTAMVDIDSQAPLPSEAAMPVVSDDEVPTHPCPLPLPDGPLVSTNEMQDTTRAQPAKTSSSIRIILAWDYFSWNEQSTMFENLTQAIANHTTIALYPPYQWVLPAITYDVGSSVAPLPSNNVSTGYLLVTRFAVDAKHG